MKQSGPVVGNRRRNAIVRQPSRCPIEDRQGRPIDIRFRGQPQIDVIEVQAFPIGHRRGNADPQIHLRGHGRRCPEVTVHRLKAGRKVRMAEREAIRGPRLIVNDRAPNAVHQIDRQHAGRGGVRRALHPEIADILG